MKRIIARVYFAGAVLLPVLAFVIIPPWHSRYTCLHRLMVFDHAVNCPRTVVMETEEGNIDADGNWITNQWVAMLRDKHLHCPKSGKKFILPAMRVGVHPYCPTHGHLIEESGYVSHEANPRGEWLAPVMGALLISAIALPMSALIVIAVRTTRRRQKNHNQ